MKSRLTILFLLLFSILTSTVKIVALPKIESVEYKAQLVYKPYVAYLCAGGKIEVWREGNKYRCTHYINAMPISTAMIHPWDKQDNEVAQEEFEIIEKAYREQNPKAE